MSARCRLGCMLYLCWWFLVRVRRPACPAIRPGPGLGLGTSWSGESLHPVGRPLPLDSFSLGSCSS